MTRVPTTYRIEERLAERPAQMWHLSGSRETVLEMFASLVADDAVSDEPLFGPHSGHRLVVLAVPVTGAPVHPDNVEDLYPGAAAPVRAVTV